MITHAKISQLQLDHVSFAYGHERVVDDASLSLKPGEWLFVVGPNGCGKSTLLRMAIGELLPRAGKVLLDNQPTKSLHRGKLAQTLSLVPQQNAMSIGFGYTVREMVLMARYAGTGMGMGFETANDLEIANKAMWASDVHHLAERSIMTLSGGERQRVAIARAVAQDTPFILLDEPTSALDLHHQLELMEQLRRMTAEENRGVLMVTHDLNLALRFGTRAALMDRGKIIADGKPDDVLTPKLLEPVYRVQVHRENQQLTFARRP